MKDYSPEQFRQLTPLEKVKYFAQGGDSYQVTRLVLQGELDSIPEAEARSIVSDAYSQSARNRDVNVSRGNYSDAEWESPELQEIGATFSQKERARALEIKLNPDGLSLKEQLNKMFPSE